MKINVDNFHGVLGSSGNIHFFWYQIRTQLHSGMYCRLSPDGEVIDGPRALRNGDRGSFVPIIDSQGRIWVYQKNRNVQFDNIVLRQVTEEGVTSEDSVYITNRPLSNVFKIAIAPNDIVYHFYGKSHNGNVSMWCTAFDLDGRVIIDDEALSDTVNRGAASSALLLKISSDSTLYLIHTINSRFYVKLMNLNLETLSEIELSRSNLSSSYGGEIDTSKNFHVIWQSDTRGENFPERYHLTYAIINRQGEYLYGPEWISNRHSNQYECLQIKSIDFGHRYICFRDVVRRNPNVCECFFKYYPYEQNSVLPVNKTKNLLNHTLIFPNPTNNSFNLNFKTENQCIFSISLYDLSARLIFKKTVTGTESQITLPLEIESGLYIVRIQTKYGVEMQKLIIVR